MNQDPVTLERRPRAHPGAIRIALLLLVGCIAGWAFEPAIGAEPPSGTDVVFRDSIDTLPLQDLRVAGFPGEWLGSGSRPYGAFYDPSHFGSTIPVKETLNKGVLELQVDTGNWYCGSWLKFENVDWSEYEDWQLALRVRFAETMFRRFKVEVKQAASNPGNAPRRVYLVDLEDRELGEMRRRGFGDIRLPLSKGVGDGSLKGVAELVLVFEADRVETVEGKPRKGQVLLHSIRLVPPKAKKRDVAAGEILDDLASRAFAWFETYRHPQSGLIPDRAPNWRNAGWAEKPKAPCSIAAVGYYLSLLPDAVKTKRLTDAQGRERALTVLRFLETNAEHHAGLLHHFLDMETGKPAPRSEVSVLDSAIFFNGCLVASAHFGGDVAAAADRLLARVNWAEFRWPAEAGRPELLVMAWNPRKGNFGPMDVRSSEFAMPYFLAVGAEANGIEPKLWRNTAVKRGPVEGKSILNPTHGLFTSYYGLGWHMLKGRTDPDGVDFWENARATALANRAFCRGSAEETYQLKRGGWWGISAGDSPRGYIAPGPMPGDAGGTVWPTAALAALPWASAEIDEDVVAWAQSPAWEYVAGPYGLAPFNLKNGWIGSDLIGIDLGSFYLAVANHRRATVWDLWKQHPIARRAIERIYESQP